jgi:intraflagellar transport protein 88
LGSRQGSRIGSRGSMPGSAVSSKSAQLRSNLLEEEEEEEEYRPREREVDSTYSDPLGPAPERPRTSAGARGGNNDDDFADEEIGDDLLPE